MKNVRKENKLITILAQAFYGNRTATQICPEEMDRFILGYMDNSISLGASVRIDRTILPVSEDKHLVIIYNRYQEEARLYKKERWLREEGYELKPLATITERNMKIYSRCIACRRNDDGELESLQKEDCHILMRYFSE